MLTYDYFTKRVAPALIALIALFYGLSLQSIPNGSSDPYMIDVGETQVALHVWGVLHATGYPLYTILGNLFTPLPQILGLNPATGASLFSALWTLVALSLFYQVLAWAGVSVWVRCGVVGVLAVLRSVWVHSVVAEVYSFSLAILLGLWWLALVPAWPLRHRLYALAFLGGIGVAHHRLLGFAGLGLLWVLLPDLRQTPKKIPLWLLHCVGLFALGFLPYLYLPLRANARAEWVYSPDLNTWDGFWFHFWGREADYLVKTPTDGAGWWDNLVGTVQILTREMSLVGVFLVLLAFILSAWQSPQRRLWQLTTLNALGFIAFALAYHQAVLPEATLMLALPTLLVYVALAFEWLMARDFRAKLILLIFPVWIGGLIFYHQAFVQALSDDPTGLESIAAASDVPRNPLERPVFMLSWGPRYFAASYSRLVTGENADLLMVAHTADFAALAAEGYIFYTEPDTFYGYPPSWWAEQIGPIYLSAVGKNTLRLSPAPRLVENMPLADLETELFEGIWLAGYEITCQADQLVLAVAWYAQMPPRQDLSVKVHLTRRESPQPLALADASAPVLGWRPTSTWQAGELIQDYYILPHVLGGEQIILGFYESLPDGGFANYGDYPLPLPC